MPLDATTLGALCKAPASLRLVEPGLYSVYASHDPGNSYDRAGAMAFYDLVACNRFYNRLVWGYWPSALSGLCRRALAQAPGEWMLDAGCGSLAFSARVYAACRDRPVVCLDRSLKLLRLARQRLARLAGGLPDNIVFLHADALDMPFAAGTFATVLCLNLLHVLADAPGLLRELARVGRTGANMAGSTLVRAGRLGDRYLELWGRAGELIPRSRDEVAAHLAAAGLAVGTRVQGNMLFWENQGDSR
jgi:SAM-dependent methyltransferase